MKGWNLVDKRAWRRGEWDKEPDFDAWIDPASGYLCQIMRPTSLGHLCGYVTVPETHPIFQREREEYGSIEVAGAHGGITYDGEDKRGGRVLGFDCGHAWDDSPHRDTPYPYSVYRNWAYVERCIKDMCIDLHLIEAEAATLGGV